MAGDGWKYDLQTPKGGMPGQTYRMCWGVNPIDLTDWRVDVGRFDVQGPNFQPLSCTMTKKCALTLTGHALAAQNRVQIRTHQRLQPTEKECN